ncbi:hypothetical protein EK21DRAFT_115341 [Setomelanomma holmii]|uniref:Heterokaryon incompatibility domain-containing protein n=1 Tax=Setomelanomma holmii TaxID=210430 RepID=A0A9P4LJ83_9PLEO|nr:hypothetical protein EK21DRAFT_115341 [Setomelanomma holmii]
MAHRVRIWLRPDEGDQGQTLYQTSNGQLPASLRSLRVLSDICKRAWFRRVWVVQEQAVLQDSPIVHLGLYSGSWDTLSTLLDEILRWNQESEWWKVTHGDSSELWLEFLRCTKPTADLASLRSLRSKSRLAEILVRTEQLQATDPRDKVFGVLAMPNLETSPERLEADYAKIVQQVFAETSVMLIEEDPGLPSWAVNFTIISRNPGLDRYYNHSNELSAYHIISPKPKQGLASMIRLLPEGRLQPVGVYTATVSETSKDILVPSSGDHDRFESHRDLIDTLFHLYDNMMRSDSIRPITFFQAVCLHSKRIMDLPHVVKFQRLLDLSPCDRRPRNEMTDHEAFFMEACCIRVYNKILFTTDARHIGETYHPDAVSGIEPGDIVAGLFGINLPFILRQNESTGEYRMIAVAHIVDHAYNHSSLTNAPEGTTEDDIWNDLNKFGLKEYIIV